MNNHENAVLHEVKDLWHSLHFLVTKYYRDPRIKELRALHTEAMHEELVNNDKMPYKLAVGLSKSTPMPVQNHTIKGMLCLVYGIVGPGRVYEEAFNRVPKYIGASKKWVFRGCIAGDLLVNNPTGTAVIGLASTALELGINWTYQQITGDNLDLHLKETITGSYIAVSYLVTLKDAIKFEKTGKYTHNIMGWTRFPGAAYMWASYGYHKYIQATQRTSKSTHILNT